MEAAAVGYEELAASQLALQRRVSEAQADRAIKVGQETAEILENTLNNAARSYRAVTIMCVTMFAVGLGLFATSSIYGAFFAQDKVYPLVFSGIGAATFVAVFITGAISKTQRALSDLVQVEIAFMNFFEQITIWDAYAVLPVGNPPTLDPTKIEKASDVLQKRSMETMTLLQNFTEVADKDG